MEDIVKNEFQFYSKLAKPLILNLPKSKDRILAAAWIKKFMDENVGDEKLRTTYLKLLLFCLQRRRLTGIFSDDPIEYDMLEDLPPNYDLNELAKNLLEQEKTEKMEKFRMEMMGDMAVFPAYTTDCSPDLTEYVAAQDIPNFGVHAYYAISNQPINKWQKSEKAIFPKGIKSAIDTTIITEEKPDSCICEPKGATSAPEVEESPEAELPECKRKKEEKTPEKKKKRPKKLGQSPPSHPIGEVRKVQEDRLTPTWGTNLLEVRDPIDIGKIDEPTEVELQLEEEVAHLLEDDEDKGDDRDGTEEEIKSKADDMLHIIDEWKHGKLDEIRSKKLPSRLSKLGDRTGIKVPKSVRAGPKIAVKGMKKGKGKGIYGPKPENLPEEFADWDEKDLEEAGLTWADLMPIDDDIDDELKKIEDDVMGDIWQDEGEISYHIPDYDDLPDYDALIREAEAELQANKTVYDEGVEEDEPVIELFDDELEELEDQQNTVRIVEEVQKVSPAITSGIPVTTPRRSPTPRRTKSPETSFAEEDDVLLKQRVSPLRPPKDDPSKKAKKRTKEASPPSVPGAKDPNISRVFEEIKSAVDDSFLQHEADFQQKEFERIERQFAAEEQCLPCSPQKELSQHEETQMIYQKAQKQEQLLRRSPELERAETLAEAWQLETHLRQGSPQAQEIIQEAEARFSGRRERQIREDLIGEQPPPAFEGYETPPERTPPSLLEQYPHPEGHLGMELAHVEDLDNGVPVEPFTPYGESNFQRTDMVPHYPRRRIERIPYPEETPRREFRQNMISRRLFPEDGSPCEPCGPPTSVDRVAQRQPRIGTPTALGERRSRRLFEGEDSGVQPQYTQEPAEFHVTSPYFSPKPGPSRVPTGLTPQGYNSDFESPPPVTPPQTPRFPPARRILKRGKYPKYVSPPPRSTVSSAPLVLPMPTPEGVAGPSRRPTGLTPPVYDSDYSPLPTPPRSPRFPQARRIVKRSRPQEQFISDEETYVSPHQIGVSSEEPICVPCSEEAGEKPVVSEESELDLSRYDEGLQEILQANLQVIPNLYTQPAVLTGARRETEEQESATQAAFFERSKAFFSAQPGPVTGDLSERELHDIAYQADIYFDTPEGLLDQSPPEMPPTIAHFPQIHDSYRRLEEAIERYDLPEASPSPVRQTRKTALPITNEVVCGAGPCRPDKVSRATKLPSKTRIPSRPKQLRETKSSQLRKQQLEKKQQEELSPTSRMLQKRREKAAKAAEARKKKPKAKQADKPSDTEIIPGADFAQDLQEHSVQFPKKGVGVMVAGQYKRISRKSEQALRLMSEIGEEEESPCRPCERGPVDDDYEGALEEGMTRDEMAAAYDQRFLEEFEEEESRIQEGLRSPIATEQIGAQFGEMDEFDRKRQEFWRQRASELTDQELSELGLTRPPAPCVPCGSDAEKPKRKAKTKELTQQQEQMLTQLRELERQANVIAGDEMAPSEFDSVEQAVIQREREEREYFENMMRGGIEISHQQPRKQLTEEEEQLEFEELERQMEAEQRGESCPASCSAQLLSEEYAQQEELRLRKKLFQQQLQLQGPRIRGRPFPASGISYSPPRPQSVFGPPPYEQPSRLSQPPAPTSIAISPRQPSPPPKTGTHPICPAAERSVLLDESPPYFEEMPEEDRLFQQPQPPSPPVIPTPPSPLLFPPEVRQDITSKARPEFDLIRRRDILPRDERRAFRAPSIGLYNLGEDEPLIPELAGDESFMGWPVIPGERGPDRRKKYYREKKRKRLFGKSESTRLCRAIEKKFDLPKLPPEPESPDYILDDSIPSDLPKPLRPEQPMEFSPLRRLPLKPIPSLPWEVDRTNFRHSRQSPPKILPNVGPIHMELYAGGGSVHPDLAGLVDYEPPLPIFEGVEDIEALQMGEELYYSPERYPEIDEIEINRRAAFAYEPPEILKNIWLSSPQDIGIHTPPSVGKGPMRTYTPSATPPLQILEASDFDQLGEDILTPKVTIPQDQLQEFFELTPPLEKEAYMQEMRSRTRKAEGRKGIRPKPMFFGGYGETPKRPIPRWYSRGGAVNIIRETEEPYSPPTPGTPPPQLPEMDEFVLLERQLEEEELNQRRSDDRQRQRDFSEMRRRMMLDEMLEQAERRDMESQRPPPRLPTPSPPPSSVLPQPDQYDEQQQSEGAPCAPWTRPAIDHAALEKYLLEEMGFGSGESFDFTPPPGTPEYLDQYTYDEFQGMESPLPLSPEDQAPCFPCTPPTPPSPPPPPPSYQPTESLLQMYIKEMERIEREKQEREARRQALYQSNLEEIQQMFGPSPGPPSPPDPDFYAKVYMHQVPDTFRQGYRPGTSIRDQIGKKEVFRQLPRRTPSPSLDSITEPRVRITIPQDARQKPLQRPKSVAPVKYASRQEAVATLAPTQPIDKRADAQRIAEARKQYQQMGRQKKILPQKGTSFARQPSLQGEDVETTCPGARRMITPEEGQRLAKERLRARKRKEEDFSLDKTKRASAPPAPPQNPPTNYFVPPQVQMRRRTPAPQIQSIEDFVRDPKVAVERTGSRSRLQGAHVRTQRPQERTQAGGGCGGSGQACGSVGPQISGTKVRLAGQQPAMRRPVQQSSRPQKGDGCGGGCGARGSRPGKKY